MITYNNIVSKFEEFVDNHHFLKTFSHGSPSGVDLDKFETYPLLHLVYTGGGYDSNIKTYTLEIYILDNPPRQDDKTEFQKSVVSQCEMVAEDILADIQNGGNIFSFGHYYELQSATITPLENESTNILAGSLLNLSIGVTYAYDACNAPIDGVDPDGSIPQPFKARGLLRVKEVDGDPDVTSVATINVPDGSLTDNGDGEITLTFGGGGDADTAEKIHFPVRNETGAVIPAGAPLYSLGEIGNSDTISVGIANASDPLKMPAIGIAETELAASGAGRDGFAIMAGTFNTNLSGFVNLQVNDVLYVQATSTGQLLQAKPSGATDLIQNVGIVLKTNGSICQGLKVSCIGRTNDLPNIAPGRFFYGDGSNRAVASSYGFPVFEPNDKDILVYNDLLGRFEATSGSSGQVSTFSVTRPNHNEGVSGGTSELIDWGSTASDEPQITQTLNAGWVLGYQSIQNANNLQCLPLPNGTTIDLSFSIEVRVNPGTLGGISLSTSNGTWTGLSGFTTIVGGTDIEWIEYSFTSSTTVKAFQLASSLQFQIQNLTGTTILYRNPSLDITVNHA